MRLFRFFQTSIAGKIFAIIGLSLLELLLIIFLGLAATTFVEQMGVMATGERGHTVSYFKASSSLQRFALNGNSEDFKEFENHIGVAVRINSMFGKIRDMLGKMSDEEIGRALVVDADNKASMARSEKVIMLVDLLKDNPIMIRLIDTSMKCNRECTRLIEIGDRMKTSPETAQRMALLKEIEAADDGLTIAAEEFASNLRDLTNWLGKTARTVFLVIALSIFGIGLLIAWLISRSIVKPMKSIVDFVQVVSKGDLSQRLKLDSRDETARLAESMNELCGRMGTMVKGIVDEVQELSSASDNLADVSKQMKAEAEEMSMQSGLVNNNAGQVQTGIEGVAASTEQLSASVNTMASAVEQMTASVAEVARNASDSANTTQKAKSIAASTGEVVSRLKESASQIDQVIQVIVDIAEQTKLLALNATIEAARAGEAGKGFAVVAGEVKELAGQTAASTEDIKMRIQEIQNTTGQAVDAIDQVVNVINQVNELAHTIASAVEEQSATASEIAMNISQAASAANEVSSSTVQTASLTREITGAIGEVAHASAGAAEGSNKVNTASETLKNMAHNLQDMVNQFKI